MKQSIINALKTKFVGVSENILNRIAEKGAKTVTTEEQVATYVEGVTFQQIIDSEADSRATQATQSAVANYEKKHSLKEGKPIETPAPPTTPTPPKEDDKTTPEWAKAIIESNKALSEKLARIEGEKTTNTRKQSLTKVLENAPEKIRQRYEKDFERYSFKDDEDFNAWVAEITPDIEAITTEYNAKGGVVTRPKAGSGGGGKGDEINPILKSRIAEQEAAKSAPAIQGLQNETK
ncbi:MAG: hypothetical protein LBO74_08550 [Candidatus Symbiothrix sp.]|nr:hypothetical protein [Candidatus Symbiothrix sp.]